MNPSDSPAPTREEFNEFVLALLHDLRNRLNGIALEAADLAEQAGPPANADSLQRQVRECAIFLKNLRELVSPDDAGQTAAPVPDLTQKLRRREIA